MASNSIRSRRDERRAPKRAPARRKPVDRFADLQRELRTNKERWRAVIGNPFMGVTVLDKNHYFIMANPIFQSMVGYNDKELKKLTPLDITPDDAQRETNRVLFKELQQGTRDHFDQIKQLQRKDGKTALCFQNPVPRIGWAAHLWNGIRYYGEDAGAGRASGDSSGAYAGHAGKPHGCHGGFDRPRDQSVPGRHSRKCGRGLALDGPNTT